MRRSLRAAELLATALALLATACGGGGGGGPTQPPPPTPGVTFSSAAAPGANSLSLQSTGETGGNLLVLELRAESVSDLYGLAFDLTYPSGVLTLEGVSEGALLSQNGAVPTSLQTAENPTGRLIVGLSRLGAVAGASGSGVLLTLRFRAAASGTGTFAFSQNRAFDAGGQAQSAVDWIGGSVSAVL